MTVTTDSEMVRREFEPTCSSNSARLRAISEVQEQGVPSCITMTPLLHVENAERFGQNTFGNWCKAFHYPTVPCGKGTVRSWHEGGAIDFVAR